MYRSIAVSSPISPLSFSLSCIRYYYQFHSGALVLANKMANHGFGGGGEGGGGAGDQPLVPAQPGTVGGGDVAGAGGQLVAAAPGHIGNKPLLGSPLLCQYILHLLGNGTDLKKLVCSDLFRQDKKVAGELSRAGITVENSKAWWGRFREKERSHIETAIIGIPAERIRLAAAMNNGGGNNGAGGGASANA